MSDEEEMQQGCGCLLFILLLAGGLYFYRRPVASFVHKAVQTSEAMDKRAAARRTGQRAAAARDLSPLYRYDGKYPSDVNLLLHPRLKQRLQRLLGAQYAVMRRVSEAESPIEVREGMMYAEAMQAHSGASSGAALLVDLEKNVVYVGIRQNHRVKLYSENGDDVPAQLQAWANEDEADVDGRDI